MKSKYSFIHKLLTIHWCKIGNAHIIRLHLKFPHHSILFSYFTRQSSIAIHFHFTNLTFWHSVNSDESQRHVVDNHTYRIHNQSTDSSYRSPVWPWKNCFLSFALTKMCSLIPLQTGSKPINYLYTLIHTLLT